MKNYLYRIYLIQLFIVLIFVSSLFAQNRANNKLDIHMDFAQFQGSEEQTILEIFYSIPRISIAHIESEEGLIGEYKFSCKIFQNDSFLTETSWSGKDFAESQDLILSNQTINDYHLLLLKPNEYKFEIDYFTHNGEKKHSITKILKIQDFSKKDLKLSSIQFCSNIERTEASNKFVKNGYQLTLNPSSIFGTQRSVLFYYSEIYNLSELKKNLDSSYIAYSLIKNNNGEIINKSPLKKKNRLGSSLVQIGQVYLGSLKSGVYDFELIVVDNSSKDSSSTSKNFFVYRPSDYIVAEGNGESEDNTIRNIFIVFSEEELDYEFELIKYIATADEKDSYSELNLVGKRGFMEKFWSNRNKINANKDSRKDFFENVEFANLRYSSGGKEGWDTDPGRIILTYGKPDELDKYTSSKTLGQYEIWEYYYVQGGVQFVFVDTQGYGDLRLVHSTVMDEIQDYQWQQRYLQW